MYTSVDASLDNVLDLLFDGKMCVEDAWSQIQHIRGF